MKQRIYLDTSVIGGAFDEEFKKITIQLFEMANEKKFTLVISSLTLSELDLAPPHIKVFFNKLDKSNIELITSNLLTQNEFNIKYTEPHIQQMYATFLNLQTTNESIHSLNNSIKIIIDIDKTFYQNKMIELEKEFEHIHEKLSAVRLKQFGKK